MNVSVELEMGTWEKSKSGLYLKDKRVEQCNSYVDNFNKWLYSLLCDSTGSLNGSAVDTGGTARTINAGGSSGAVIRLLMSGIYTSGVATGGIQVGTGIGATTISTYAIGTLIAHGIGAGQLSYGAISLDGWTTSGADSWYAISRAFTNSSGGNITVTEVTAVARMNSTTTHHFLFERTKLSSSETVNNGTTKTFTYKFKVTV